MIKALRKAIMHRSKLKNILHKARLKEDWDNYKKQRNVCVNLPRSTKKYYFQISRIWQIIKIWKTIKPSFSNKGLNSNKLILREKNAITSDEKTFVTFIIIILSI